MTQTVCPPPRDAKLVEKIKHDYHNAYYRTCAAYVCVMLTVIVVLMLIDR
jgi:hypothetical protein